MINPLARLVKDKETSFMKTLGILGGMGHKSTAYFYELLTAWRRDKTCPNVILYSKGIPPSTTEFILGQTEKDPTEELIVAVKLLETSGATQIAIPCATAHYFYDKLAAAVNIPIINLIAEMAQVVANKGFTRVGLLAKEGTVHADLFQRELLMRGIHTLTPPAENQSKLSDVITCLEKGKSHDGNNFEAVAEDLYTQGAEGIILGCTELSLISRGEAQGFIDSLTVLTNLVYK